MNKIIKICLIFYIITTNNILFGNFYSQFGQDKFIYEKFFKGKRDGIFVDIGAHDGITYSNTAFLEKELNWTGICIEPLPTVFEKLIENRNCMCINGCIYTENCQKDFLAIDGNGYFSMFSGFVENLNPRYLAYIENQIQQQKASATIITVDCYHLHNILDLCDITTIDYLSIDTEGGEFNILKSIDFDKITIYIIDVENNNNNPSFRKFLESKGYSFVTKLGVDEIYQKNSDKI